MLIVPSTCQTQPQQTQLQPQLPTFSFTVLPSYSYLAADQTTFLTQASPQACLANCQSCQIATNQCEECLSPYFRKVSVDCLLNPRYVVRVD